MDLYCLDELHFKTHNEHDHHTFEIFISICNNHIYKQVQGNMALRKPFLNIQLVKTACGLQYNLVDS